MWRRLMTRLLLRDGIRRYRSGLSLGLLASIYLWRSMPPWVVRDGLWSLSPWQAALAVVASAAAYVVLTFPVARRLVASNRLEYWRQFSISAWQWRRLRWFLLALINLPALGAMAYMAAPIRPDDAIPDDAIPIVASACVVLGYAGLIAVQSTAVARHAPRSQVRSLPNVKSAWAAVCRLHWLAAWRRERNTASASVVIQLALAAMATLGASHVAATEPSAAWLLIRTLAVLGAVAAAWTPAMATRALDRDRWFLDTLGTTPHAELQGRFAAGVLMGAFTIAGATAAGAMTGTAGALRGAFIGIAAVALGSASSCTLVAAAEARRDIRHIRPARITVRATAALLVMNLLGAWAIMLVAAMELALAVRALRRAAVSRARFETPTKEDDHD